MGVQAGSRCSTALFRGSRQCRYLGRYTAVLAGQHRYLPAALARFLSAVALIGSLRQWECACAVALDKFPHLRPHPYRIFTSFHTARTEESSPEIHTSIDNGRTFHWKQQLPLLLSAESELPPTLRIFPPSYLARLPPWLGTHCDSNRLTHPQPVTSPVVPSLTTKPLRAFRLQTDSYYDRRHRQSAALIRARRPYLVKNTVLGLGIAAFAAGVCKLCGCCLRAEALPSISSLNSTVRWKGEEGSWA